MELNTHCKQRVQTTTMCFTTYVYVGDKQNLSKVLWIRFSFEPLMGYSHTVKVRSKSTYFTKWTSITSKSGRCCRQSLLLSWYNISVLRVLVV